jgi:hypothetical protein
MTNALQNAYLQLHTVALLAAADMIVGKLLQLLAQQVRTDYVEYGDITSVCSALS